MAAFAMASMAMAASLLLLAVLRCGSLGGYFLQTVMTDVMGKLWRDDALNFVNTDTQKGYWCLPTRLRARSRFQEHSHLTIATLFSGQHMPLLAASALPTLLIYAIRYVGVALRLHF